MKFAGWQRTTLIDFPGKISSVLFAQGCSMRCRFCHNPELVQDRALIEALFREEDILAYLAQRKSMLEGVVLTGGEPTVQKDIIPFIEKVRALGYAIKLDTNGYQPEKLADILKTGCVDYVAMDVKAPLSKYSYIAGVPIITSLIQQSLEILAQSSIDYELRTTAVKPLLSLSDLLTIAHEIKGAPLWFIQQFRSGCTLDLSLQGQEGYKEEELLSIAQEAAPAFVKECRVR